MRGLGKSDGCIYVPNHPVAAVSVSIVFNSKDLPLPLLIQKELKIVNIYKMKGKNAYNFIISDIRG